MSTIPAPDFAQALQHVEHLTGDPNTLVWFRMIHDSDKAKPARTLFGTVKERWPEIVELQRQGYGAFIVVNPGGNSDAEITGISACFGDADNVSMPTKWHVTPDFIVQRDAAHFHAYWLVNDLPVEKFKEVQQRLAVHYGTDPKVCNPSRVMRLAGTLHQKGASILVRIKSNLAGLEVWERGHTTDELTADLAVLERAARISTPREAAASIDPDHPINVAQAIRYARHDAPPAIAECGGNETTLKVALCVRDKVRDEDLALSIMEDYYNPRCEPEWSAEEIATINRNAWCYGENEPGCDAIIPVVYAPELIARLSAETEAATADCPHGYAPAKLASELANGSFLAPWYVWKDFILAECLNLIYGDGGSGKTLLLLMIAVAVAAGITLFGRDTMQMPVVLVLLEDDYGAIKLHLQRICEALGVKLESLPLYIWCLPGEDATLASVLDDGSWQTGPLWAPLRALLAKIGRPVFLGLDTVSDIAALDETKRLAVNTLCKRVLGSICRDFNATIAVNAHPSKAAMADGSGYAGSTAWNNSVRNRLTLEQTENGGQRRKLKVAKANYGSNAEVELHMADGVFWERDQGSAAELNERLTAASVTAALAAAEQGTPVQTQRRPPKWVFDEIERGAGRRPTLAELREVLAYAQRGGRLRYLKGNTKRMAGYYPWDELRAVELAAEAKRHAASVEALSANANRREARHA